MQNVHRGHFLQQRCRIDLAAKLCRCVKWQRIVVAAAISAFASMNMSGCTVPLAPITGVVWQPDSATLQPRGNWQLFGAHELLVQWTSVDGIAFVQDPEVTSVDKVPDWQRIAGEPWARDVILGLAGRFDETAARNDIANLAKASERLAKLPTPLHVVGWYFPVEIDPTWQEAAQIVPLLEKLPRPLWISVYDRGNIGPKALADNLAKWLPADIGIFFQDGVGVYAREAYVAASYIDALSARFGRQRVRVIAEAFRPKVGEGFRSATLAELQPQLSAYRGYEIYLFDGPHYMSDALTNQLAVGRSSDR